MVLDKPPIDSIEAGQWSEVAIMRNTPAWVPEKPCSILQIYLKRACTLKGPGLAKAHGDEEKEEEQYARSMAWNVADDADQCKTHEPRVTESLRRLPSW